MILPSLVIWDTFDPPPDQMGLVYRWDGYAETESVRSLLRYVEMHAAQLRAKYMAFIHNLGESRIKGKRLIDHLAFEDGLSYWWMTLFVEKSHYKSPISYAIRLFALEEIIVEGNFTKILMVGGNRVLHGSILGLCENLGICYEWKRVPVQKQRLNIKSIYKRLPNPVRAVISLIRHVIVRWPLKGLQKAKWFDGNNSVFLCSYFIHLDLDSCSKGCFYSRQWEMLPKLLHESGLRTNWIHHYLRSNVVPNTEVALNWVNRFNQDRHQQGFHIFLDSYLSCRSLCRVLLRWWRLLLIALRLGEVRTAFRPEGSPLSFWPLLKEDWYASMCGPTCMSNMLWIELFDAAMRGIPHQKMGFYLCENQSWERAFIHAWRKFGHGRLIAVAHSTVRFWDLRYFADPRTIESRLPCPLPLPDVTALNGRAAMDAFSQAGQPLDETAESEALRYMYVGEAGCHRNSGNKYPKVMKLLILGDYMPESTEKMLHLLDSSATLLSGIFSYTVKPHPNFMVCSEDFPNLKLKIVTDSLANIISDYDIAYASNTTTAAVDAYLAGLPVVVMLDDTELNYSPLRGQQGVRFVTTPEELSGALQAVSQDSKCASNHHSNEFFFLDPDMPRWRRICGF